MTDETMPLRSLAEKRTGTAEPDVPVDIRPRTYD